MKQSGELLIMKAAVIVSFVAMVTVNALANILPINGVNTGQVSDSYPNLFAPAGLTFSIWGLIYLLLGGYSLYQLGVFNKQEDRKREALMNTVGKLFVVSSVANILWIFSWHYDVIPLSLVFMLIILGCLIAINRRLAQERLSFREKVFLRLPFSIYFGWITVATIANTTVLLVSLNWNGFGIADQVWTVVVLIIGVLIGIATMVRNHDIAYGAVFVWAYGGIILKHVSAEGFSFQYPSVVYTASSSILVVLLAMGWMLLRKPLRPQGNRTEVQS